MRRSSLLALAALGAVICLLGGTGLFAALTDTARTGPNTANSAALAASADIQVAPASIPATTPPNWVCQGFSEELATGFFAASNVAPGYGSVDRYYCLRNVGSQSVTVTALSTELVDVDLACSGDEAEFDETCGGDKEGELAAVLAVTYYVIGRCVDGAFGSPAQTHLLATNTTLPASLGSLAPGETKCYGVRLSYPSGTAADAVQRAQSDEATWRITLGAQS
jgi:hypothetical protein